MPGVWTNWASTASEWNSGLLIPPPKGARMVTWQWYRPRERCRYLPSCGPSWWKPCAVKPRNWISATGTMPAMASPSDAPMMLASASGVSTTRSAPNRSTRPLVVLNTPPSLPTSRPSTMTRGSASISSANALLIASTMLRCVISCVVPVEQLGLLPNQSRRRVLIDVREDILGSGHGGGARELERTLVLVTKLLGQRGFPLRVPQPKGGQVLLDALDRVARARFLVLLRVLVTRRVVGRVVEAHPIGDGFNEGRPAAAPRPRDRFGGDVKDGHDVVPVHLGALQAVSGRAQGEAAGRRLDPSRGRDGPLVVLEEENDRRLHDSRQVQRLVEIALRGAAVPDVRDHHRVLPAEAEAPREPGRVR